MWKLIQVLFGCLCRFCSYILVVMLRRFGNNALTLFAVGCGHLLSGSEGLRSTSVEVDSGCDIGFLLDTLCILFGHFWTYF